MNFLFHLVLSGEEPELLVGNFMGDFVKGPLGERFTGPIRHGLMLHRKIDSFASNDEHFQRSRLRLAPHYGLYRGVLVDLFYDHYLVVTWHDWQTESLDDYLSRVRGIMDDHRDILPAELQRLVPIIFEELIPSYRSISGIGAALSRMSRRITRQNPLSGGELELLNNYEDLAGDFRKFMPGIQKFAATLRNAQE